MFTNIIETMHPPEQQTSSYQEDKRFVSRSFNISKEEFSKEYGKIYCGKPRAKELFFVIVTELKSAIFDGNLVNFKHFGKLIDYISGKESLTVLKTCQNDKENLNLVILACKHNRIEILKYIFSNSRLFKNISIIAGKNGLVPGDKDETSHDVFYYAIRSGNTEILSILIDKWPGSYFATRSLELDEILSRAYEQLKLQNVSLSDEMEIFVENKLINLRFFSNTSGQFQTGKGSLNCIMERINLVLEKISLLKSEYSNGEKVDAKFLFVGRFIAQNIYILKRQLKSTYDRLPWEEIEFCLVAFVSSYLKQQEINLFYRAILNKSKILLYLENFANKLENVKPFIASLDVNKLAELPKLIREQVVANIIHDGSQFLELYGDYEKIRDVHSLEKVSDYLNLALSTDPKEREGQIIITRTLQVIGEYFKNTLESPKLSSTTSELLLLSLPKNTRKIIIDLRNSLSHAYSLSKRTEIFENTNVEFFIGIQNDVKRIDNVITDILHNNRFKMIGILLKTIVSSESVDEIRTIFEVMSNVELKKMISHDFKMMELENLEKLIQQISDAIIDKTNYEKELFKKINDIISCAKTKSESIRDDYSLTFVIVSYFCVGLRDANLDRNSIRGIKFFANKTLENFIPRMEYHSLKKIVDLLEIISASAQSRMRDDDFDRIDRLKFEIFYIAEFEVNDIKWVTKLRKRLHEKSSTCLASKKGGHRNIIVDKCNKHLTEKLSELKDILNSSSSKLIGYKKNKKLQAVVEMLVLDILSILGRSEKHFENNLLFLDSNAPLLIGKSLRNHLAHGNILLDLLLSDPSLAVVLNAEKLVSENIASNKKKIGKLVRDDPFRLNQKFGQVLTTITNQENMFSALMNGNLKELQHFLEKGADINSKSIDLSTSLHFAAQGPNLDLVRFIVDQNLPANSKDRNGRTPLHIAAARGRKNTVEFFLSQATIPVDDPDKYGKTPLHLAASSGHEDTVEILLKNNANSNTKDFGGNSPLHYAAGNNHVEVLKVFLKKEANVDTNETMGGFTSLHIAAEFGCLEVVNFLLENGAEVNAKNDNKGIPLHTAALNGHLEVVIALILKGADVNAKVLDGCTPLHYAVENGHEKVARVLLEHGAEKDVTDKTYNNTPLHYAAKDGREEIVEIFLKKKANVNIVTKAGITPLQFAAESGHLKIVCSLLQYGANIYARDIRNYSTLHYAAKNGHEEMAQFLIQNGAEVDAKGFNNVTPLHLAASEGHQRVIDLLIKNKAEVNHRDLRGSTPLFAAAENGHKGVIEILLKNEAQVYSRSFDGSTPLHVAALGGYYDSSVLLLDHAADVNAKDAFGNTPLHTAISNGHKEIITILIEHGAQVDTESIFSGTPLNIALEANHKEIVEILIANGAKVDLKSNKSLPLISAIRNNNKELIEILIAKGANVNAEQGQPLSLAVLSGYQDVVELLLKNHARVDIKGAEDATPLHLAAGRGHIEIVEALIARGADVNVITTKSVSPLSAAAEAGHSEVAAILLANGARVDIDIRLFPLHLAAARGHVNVIDVLLRHGAEVDVKDDKGRTALELAVANGHLAVVKTLMQHKPVNLESKGNKGVTLLLIAAQQKNLELVKFLVDNGSDINARNDAGSKCIHIAARDGFQDAVEFFLFKGMDINDPGACSHTPLHYAIMKNQVEVVKYLLGKGANVNAKDINGSTPMHMAAVFGFKSIIDILLKNGAFLNAVDDFNGTPLKVVENKDMVFYDVPSSTPCELNNKEDVINLLSSTENLFDAVKRNSSSDVEKFVKAGAFINAKNTDKGATPLHYGAWKGYEDVVSILLENKADPNSVNSEGNTALHYAAKFSHLKCVKVLMCYGAIYNAVSETGKTPVALTDHKGITDLFKVIDDSFKMVRNNKNRVIDHLNKVNVDDLKAIMNARDRENRSLIAVALQSNSKLADALKHVSQSDVPYQLNEAWSYLNKGDYHHSLNTLKRLVERKKQLLGPDNPATLDMQTYVAKALYKQGNYQKALDMLEEIFNKQKELLGINIIDTLDTRSAIALVMHRQGKNEEAINIYREIYPKQKAILGPNDPDTVNTQFHMALVLHALGEFEEALSINKAVFEMRKKTQGMNHMNTIMAQNNIAMVLSSQGKYEEALKMYEKVLNKKKQQLGINNADTLRTMCNIASTLLIQKKFQEAYKAYEEVLSIQKKTLIQNHPETLNTQYNMANVLLFQGKFFGAFKIFKECHDQRVNVFGPYHPSVLDAYNKMETIIKLKFKMSDTNPEEVLQHLQNEINIASSNGDLQNLKRLLETGADVNDADTEGRTPLHFAVNNCHLTIVNVLLKNGADATLVTNKGNTPLHTAASKNYKEIAQVLLQNVIDQNKLHKLHEFINAKTISGGTTSLHVAAKSGYLEILKLLLKNGATYDVLNKEGKTPVDLATDPKIIELFKLIEELFKLVKKGSVEAINKLKAMKPDELIVIANARCIQGYGLVQTAIVNKHKNIAGTLLAMLKKPN